MPGFIATEPPRKATTSWAAGRTDDREAYEQFLGLTCGEFDEQTLERTDGEIYGQGREFCGQSLERMDGEICGQGLERTDGEIYRMNGEFCGQSLERTDGEICGQGRELTGKEPYEEFLLKVDGVPSDMFAILGIYLLSAGRRLGMLFHASEVCLPQWAAGAGRRVRRLSEVQEAVAKLRRLEEEACSALQRQQQQQLQPVQQQPSPSACPALPAAAAAAAAAAAMLQRGSGEALWRIAEMRDSLELPKAYVGISAPFQLAAFALAGLGGYYFLGDKAEGMINENLPFNAGFQAAAACLRVHMLVSYLIKGVVFCRAFPRKAAREYADPNDQRKRSLFAWNLAVIPLLLCAWLVANLEAATNASITNASLW